MKRKRKDRSQSSSLYFDAQDLKEILQYRERLVDAPKWPELSFEGVSTDTRTLKPGNMYIALRGDRFDGHDFILQAIEAGASIVAVEERYYKQHEAELKVLNHPILCCRNGINFLERMARARRRRMNAQVIAVTGSVGKTSTRALIAAALSNFKKVYQAQQNMNNPIGVSQTILAAPEDTEILVLEMGMDHLGEIAESSLTAEPNCIIITNVGYSHIEKLHTRENILRAKLEIFDGMQPNALVVFPGDDPLLMDWYERRGLTYFQEKQVSAFYVTHECQDPENGAEAFLAQLHEKNMDVYKERMRHMHLGFSIDEKEGDRMQFSVYRPQVKELTWMDGGSLYQFTYELKVGGKHQVFNAALAVAVAFYYRTPEDEIRKGLLSYEPVGDRGRLEQVDGMTLFHDYYNASPESMKAAFINAAELCPDEHRRFAILGGINELGTYAPKLHEAVGRDLWRYYRCAPEHLFLVGPHAFYVAQGYCLEAKNEGLNVKTPLIAEDVQDLYLSLGEAMDHEAFYLIKGSRGFKLERIASFLKGKQELHHSRKTDDAKTRAQAEA